MYHEEKSGASGQILMPVIMSAPLIPPPPRVQYSWKTPRTGFDERDIKMQKQEPLQNSGGGKRPLLGLTLLPSLWT